jgi:glycosyltransferase involved in cell wall biosynthesis
MRVLISAYACEPNKGSEPEIGLRAVLAAASRHEVWVITRSNNVATLREFLAATPTEHEVHIHPVDLGRIAMRIKRWGLPGLHWYYDRWQKAAGRAAVHLDAEHDFDVVHHATFATAWTRAGVAHVEKPFVWGPVGGGIMPPWRLVPDLGVRGMAEVAARVLARSIAFRLPRSRGLQRRAAVTLAQNPETARQVPGRQVTVLPHSLAVEVERPPSASVGRHRSILVVGRLVAWKGGKLALRTLRAIRETDVTMHFYGAGPELDRLRTIAQRWGLTARVRFEGQIPRQETAAAIASAGVVLHTALHDESPLTVAETLSLGTPIVALSVGGPPQIVQHWPRRLHRIVVASSPSRTARALAAAVEEFLDDPPEVSPTVIHPATSFTDRILAAYESAVTSSVA